MTSVKTETQTQFQRMDIIYTQPPHTLSYLLLLTGCLAGIQFTCKTIVCSILFSHDGFEGTYLDSPFYVIGTVELAYGTPYLDELGLAKSLLALVWLAGPLSG